ncbi:MAG: hypothetical protein M9962_13300 [Oligoflexia bacterium]|nr:hypothetical protein [Oligoflexia bacterium]
MISNLVQKFYLWFVLASLIAISSCGKLDQQSNKALAVSLSPQESTNLEIFWYGVLKKTLQIYRDGKKEHEINWSEHTKLHVKLNKGDKMRFIGLSSSGDILVFGEAEVTDELNISIPIFRVL